MNKLEFEKECLEYVRKTIRSLKTKNDDESKFCLKEWEHFMNLLNYDGSNFGSGLYGSFSNKLLVNLDAYGNDRDYYLTFIKQILEFKKFVKELELKEEKDNGNK